MSKPTPETDAILRSPGPFRNGMTKEELRLADFARRLERERNKALAQFDDALTRLQQAHEQRDEAREALRELVRRRDENGVNEAWDYDHARAILGRAAR